MYLSQVTLDELNKCPEPKRTQLYKSLARIKYTQLEMSEEATAIVNRLIDMGVLTKKSLADCQHIAIATVNDCDCIISWNFKHLVNIKTIQGVRYIAQFEGYKGLEIIDPFTLLGR